MRGSEASKEGNERNRAKRRGVTRVGSSHLIPPMIETCFQGRLRVLYHFLELPTSWTVPNERQPLPLPKSFQQGAATWGFLG